MLNRLDRLIADRDYALVYRPDSRQDNVDCLLGHATAFPTVRAAARAAATCELPSLLVVPFRQLAERGFEVIDDSEKLLLLQSETSYHLSLSDIDYWRGGRKPRTVGGGFLDSDEAYCATVEQIIADEIAEGAGSNFVIRRTYSAGLNGVDDLSMLSAYADLLAGEFGAYWYFLIRVGDLYLIGASPERHVHVDRRRIEMNPISGTMVRGYDQNVETSRLLDFLSNRKESDELAMVLDEELKMLASLCTPGSILVEGPNLRHMSRVTHTEFKIAGETEGPLEDVLVRTMFAPAVTGSPVRNACRVIARHEASGRSYYAGYVGLFEPGADGDCTFDSAINIRSSQIRRGKSGWNLRTDVGATLVRDSSPRGELLETGAKAAAILSAICGEIPVSDNWEGSLAQRFRLPDSLDPDIMSALDQKRRDANPLWLQPMTLERQSKVSSSRRAVLVDAEDDFNYMLAHQLSGFGYRVNIISNEYALSALDEDALVVFGPGPGDPCDDGDPRIDNLRTAIAKALASEARFLAVCLSHQVLCRILGYEVRKLATPNQGIARTVGWLGCARRLGFYNAFAAVNAPQPRMSRQVIPVVDDEGDLTGLVGDSFISMQFHPESALSVDGTEVLAEALDWLERS